MDMKLPLAPSGLKFKAPQPHVKSPFLGSAALQQTRISSLSGTDALHFSGKTSTVSARNLLALTPAQARFEQEVKTMLKPFDVHYVQNLDEQKRPPLAVLKAFVDSGLFVSGVPIPGIDQAKSLIENDDIRQILGEAKATEMAELLTPASKASKAESVKRLQEIGQEGHNVSMSLASIELPKATSVGVSTFLGVNTGLSAQTISKIGTPEQQAYWLNALNNGIFTYGFGLTEEAVGSDPRSIQTTFKKEVDPKTGKTVYRLNGNKKYIGNAAQVKDANGNIVHRGADFLAIYAVDDAKKPPAERSFRCFMVPRTLIGEENIWHSGREHNKMGLREVNNGDFNLNDVVIPESLMLGKPDECIYKKMLGLLDITRLFVGGMSLGTSEACLDAAEGYMAKRNQNGVRIEQFQAVSFPIKKLRAQADAGRLLVMEATRLVDQSENEKAAYLAKAQQIKGLLKNAEVLLNPVAHKDSTIQNKQDTTNTLGDLIRAVKLLENDFKTKDAIFFLEDVVRVLKRTVKLNSKHTAAHQVVRAYEDVEKAIQIAKGMKEPTRFGMETAMAKLYCSELAEASAQEAINTLGGNGFIERPEQGLGLPKRRRDAKVLTIYEGTSKVNRNIISQGAFIAAIKKYNKNILLGVRNFLLSNNITKRFRYRLLKDFARTPQGRVEAAYQFAMADALNKYKVSLEKLKADWTKNGAPAQYKEWDGKSIDRQQNLLASFAIQARMQIIADMAVDRKLMQLSAEHLQYLASRPALSAEEKRRQESLQLFLQVAEESVIQKGRELGDASLKAQEAQWQKDNPSL
jgi:alkylation response protein AidB-like acyl-CoA dehydrogenase